MIHIALPVVICPLSARNWLPDVARSIHPRPEQGIGEEVLVGSLRQWAEMSHSRYRHDCSRGSLDEHKDVPSGREQMERASHSQSKGCRWNCKEERQAPVAASPSGRKAVIEQTQLVQDRPPVPQAAVVPDRMPQPGEVMPVQKQRERGPVGKWKIEEDYLEWVRVLDWVPRLLTGNGVGNFWQRRHQRYDFGVPPVDYEDSLLS